MTVTPSAVKGSVTETISLAVIGGGAASSVIGAVSVIGMPSVIGSVATMVVSVPSSHYFAAVAQREYERIVAQITPTAARRNHSVGA